MANPRKASPFFSRSYGGYSIKQENYISEFITATSPKSILDPMSGQALTLSKFALQGVNVSVSDINPACLLFANLRDPNIIVRRVELFEWFKSTLIESKIVNSINGQEIYCNDWLSNPSQKFILSYIKLFNIDTTSSPFISESNFWLQPIKKRFALSMLILIARFVVAHTISSNITWVKKGGTLNKINPIEKIIELAILWLDSYSDTSVEEMGDLNIYTGNSTDELTSSRRKYDAVITSPPYANRLDYSVMWAPELQILSFIYNHDTKSLKNKQVGSTVIKGLNNLEEKIEAMPECAKIFLYSISKDKSYAGSTYYYPFFANYFIKLSEALNKICSSVNDNGHVAVFIRDTVRKNYKFDSESFVKTILNHNGFDYDYMKNSVDPKERTIIKNHLGLKQNAERSSPIYGKAQVEWSLLFKKGTN